MADAEAIANFVVGNSASLPRPGNGDVDGDGKLTVKDAMFVAQFVRGRRASLDVIAPAVLAVHPKDGATKVSVYRGVSVFFSESVSTSALAAFSLVDVASQAVVSGVATLSNSELILSFQPDRPLGLLRTYEIRVSTEAADLAGRKLKTPFASRFTTHGQGALLVRSGVGQRAYINGVLPVPLSVQARLADGTPVANAPVTFDVTRGNGSFQPGDFRTQTITTDLTGYATATWRVGSQEGADAVLASIPDTPPLEITATVLSSAPANLRVYTGAGQIVPAGGTTALPLVVQATDPGGNPSVGVKVNFRVTQGAGSFDGQAIGSAVTDSSGTTQIFFSAAAAGGPITVQASFSGMVGQAPTFEMHTLLPEPSTTTTITGTVIDAQTLRPLGRVYVYVADAPSIWDWTDEAGTYRLSVSPGPHVVEVDGYESGAIDGKLYPVVAIPVTAVAGRETRVAMPALLPPLEAESYIDVSETQGGTLTLRSDPRWQLHVAPGSAYFRNNRNERRGRIYAAFVPPDKIPMPVAGGKASRFVDTIQPLNVQFDPPAPVSFPNVDNITPGTITEIFTLSYASGTFIRTGRGLVQEDGRLVRSLPNEGITQGGWHLTPPPEVAPTSCLRVVIDVLSDAVSSATITSFGLSAQGVRLPNGHWAFVLCGLPSNQGPLSWVISAERLGSDPPILDLDSDEESAVDGEETSPRSSIDSPPPPPYSNQPEVDAAPAPPTSALPIITGLQVQLSTDTVSAGETLKMTVTVLFDPNGPQPTRKDGIPIRFIDSPANVVTISGMQVPGVADYQEPTDDNAQVLAALLIPVAVAGELTVGIQVLPVIAGLGASYMLVNAGVQAVGRINIRNQWEIDSSVLRDLRELQPDSAAIGRFLLGKIGHVYISPAAYEEFITDAPDNIERTARLGILASFGITLAPTGTATTENRFRSVPSSPFTEKPAGSGDSAIFAAAADHGRPLITSDEKSINAYFGFRIFYGLPRMKFLQFYKLHTGSPAFRQPPL